MAAPPLIDCFVTAGTSTGHILSILLTNSEGEMHNLYPASSTFPQSHRRSCLRGSLSGRTSYEGHQAGRKSLRVCTGSRVCKRINHCSNPSSGRRRPPELGRSSCRTVLERHRQRCLPRGEALPPGGEVGLQGRTDASKTLDSRFSLEGRSDLCLLPVVHVFYLAS